MGAKISNNFVSQSECRFVSRISDPHDERWRNSLREFQLKRIDAHCWRLSGRRIELPGNQYDHFFDSFLEMHIEQFAPFDGLYSIIIGDSAFEYRYLSDYNHNF